MSSGHDASSHRTATAPPMAGAYVVAKLRDLDATLTATAPRLLADADDDETPVQGRRGPPGRGTRDEAVHDLRVAIRRMRTLLKMSRGLFGRWHTDVVRAAFADVMRATGELRDEEVLEETLEGTAEGPEMAAWLRGRKAREAKLRQVVIARIQRGDLDRARLMLKALLVFPVEPNRNVELARFARRTVERARRKVERKRDVEVTDVTGMHDLRIAYKELRYSIELLADALPIDARALLEPATVFQKRLGELHDVDVAIETIQNAKGLSLDTRQQALTSLAAMRTKRVNKYLRELDPLGTREKDGGHHHGDRSPRAADRTARVSPRPGYGSPSRGVGAQDARADAPVAEPSVEEMPTVHRLPPRK